jgi:hypothetical protein
MTSAFKYVHDEMQKGSTRPIVVSMSAHSAAHMPLDAAVNAVSLQCLWPVNLSLIHHQAIDLGAHVAVVHTVLSLNLNILSPSST